MGPADPIQSWKETHEILRCCGQPFLVEAGSPTTAYYLSAMTLRSRPSNGLIYVEPESVINEIRRIR